MSAPPLGQLANLLLNRAYTYRLPSEAPFRLASGRESWHYFDLAAVTGYASALPLLGALLHPLLLPGVVACGGPPRGADALAGAVSYYSAGTERPVNAFTLRQTLAAFSERDPVAGGVQPGDAVALVDDVLTTGGSLLAAAEWCAAADLQVAQVVVVLAREPRALARLRADLGVPVAALLSEGEVLGFEHLQGAYDRYAKSLVEI